MQIISSLDTIQTPTAIALGNFDGIHLGHQQVIQPILHGLNADGKPTVVTFCPHPQEFFSGRQRLLLTPIAEKAAFLQSLGVEQLVLLPFDRTLASLTPQEFVEKILVQQLQVQFISVGQDFCFGHKRSGTTQDLQAIAARFNIPVNIVSLFSFEGDRVSSSSIRQALDQGDLPAANRLLGRHYAITGEVVYGQQLGRTLGFPTANLKLPPEKFLPRLGVYAVQVAGVKGEGILYPGVMNIGFRPTVDGLQQTVEVHVLDWSGDLYGKPLTVSLEKFLRPEQKFASLDDLRAQIYRDAEMARSLLTLQSGASI